MFFLSMKNIIMFDSDRFFCFFRTKIRHFVPIKIIRNQENNLLSLPRRMQHAALVGKTKEIEDKTILVCILKQYVASYMQKQNVIHDFFIFL